MVGTAARYGGATLHPTPDRASPDGNFGDVRPVGAGVSELRVDLGPGYRVYFLKRGDVIVVLLCGGDKSSQARDITLAKELVVSAEELVNVSRSKDL
jgi:putative addiction module killer protein